MTKHAMPNWPRRMKVKMAADYLGISRTKFLEGVGEKYPKPVQDGRNRLWHIEDLDAAADRLKGVVGRTQGRENAFTERLRNAGSN